MNTNERLQLARIRAVMNGLRYKKGPSCCSWEDVEEIEGTLNELEQTNESEQ